MTLTYLSQIYDIRTAKAIIDVQLFGFLFKVLIEFVTQLAPVGFLLVHSSYSYHDWPGDFGILSKFTVCTAYDRWYVFLLPHW